MSNDDLELEIEIEKDEPEGLEIDAAEIAKPAGAKADGEADDAKPARGTTDPAESLREQLAAKEQESATERAARAAAERDRDRERARASNAEYQALTAALTSTTSELAETKRLLKEAYETGDYEKVTDHQERLAELAPKRRYLEETKGKFDEYFKNPPAAQPSDPVDALIQNAAAAGTPLSARTQAWFRERPEVARDGELLTIAISLDKLARRKNLAPDTDEYFAFIDEQMGLSPQSQQETRPAPRTAPPTKPHKTVAARPSRDAGVSNGNLSETKIKLSEREALAAVDGTHVWHRDDPKLGAVKGQPIGVKEFARRKMIDMKNGKYDRINVQQ